MKNQIIIAASILALLLAGAIIYRIITVKHQFDSVVRESLKTTEGYDQKFIDMVNRLEQVLAMRASFGYSGGKDPMTGTKRQVVQMLPTLPMLKKNGQPVAPQDMDQVKLTAIIGDATGKKITAVIMDGERSYSVDPGDVIAGRKITKITNEGIYMENDSLYFFYDIYGKKGTRLKEKFQQLPPAAAPSQE
jgi:hypothetical protein